MNALTIELIHASSMILFVLSIPAMFWHKWSMLSSVACVYAILFVVVNRLSHLILGECILTRMARWAGGACDNEWFTVKVTRLVFGFIPSNKAVTYIEQAFVILVAVCVLMMLQKKN